MALEDKNGDGVINRADYETKPSSLSNGLYNFMKDLVTIYAPAAIVLYSGLAVIFGWTNTDKVVGAAGLVLVFLGAVLKINSNRYAKEISDGTLILNESDPEAATIGLGLTTNYSELKSKDTVTLTVDKSGL